jgi:hypothetical protein
MPWESRDGKGQYYTRSIRCHCKVTRLYFGVGPVAELAAAQDQRRQVERYLERLQRRNEEARWRQAEEPLLLLTRRSKLLVEAALLGNGFHKHGAEWRKRRMTAEVPTPSADESSAGQTLEGLVQRARQGDKAVLPELRRLLDERPDLWQQAGDLALQARTVWLALLAGPDLLLRESIERTLHKLEAELSGSAPTALERLVVARVLAGWLQAEYADAACAQAKAAKASPGLLRDLQHRQESAQARYLAAIRMLATIRRLLPAAKAGSERIKKTQAQEQFPHALQPTVRHEPAGRRGCC